MKKFFSFKVIPAATSNAFTLMELLAVMAIISVLTVAVVPAFNAFKGAGSLTQATADLSSTLEQARAYAMGNNTYVYVGLQEVDALKPTTADGIGRVVVVVIASQDGMRPYANTPAPLTSNVTGIAKPLYFDNTHLTDDSGLSRVGGMANWAKVDSAVIDLGSVTSISKTSFNWPLSGTPKYNFTKVIEFDPQGSARMQMGETFDSSIPWYIEIPLVPAKGNTVPAAPPSNQAALRVHGMTGVARIYRP